MNNDITIPTSLGRKTPEQIMDECTYTSYATNRDQGITKEGWTRMGMSEDTAERMEERYLLENFKDSIRQAFGKQRA